MYLTEFRNALFYMFMYITKHDAISLFHYSFLKKFSHPTMICGLL